MIKLALELRPNDVEALVNFGNIFYLSKRFEEAVTCYTRALSMRPDANTWTNLGNAFHRLGRRNDALASFCNALALEPDDIQALYKRAVMLGELGNIDEALVAYDRVLALKPDDFEAFNNRAFLMWKHKRDLSKPIADLELALSRTPNLPYAAGEVLHMKSYLADWNEYEFQKKRLFNGIAAGERVARPFMFQAVANCPQMLQECARIYTRDRHPVVAIAKGYSSPNVREKIRLGYLSGEFNQQATAILMAGIYEHHDRKRFEVVAVDNGSANGSAMTTRLKQSFDQWIDIGPLDDDEAANTIASSGIDILINLNGYFGQHRMGVFARRPAPIQVNYLGFPGTLGAPYIDYIIADDVVIPPEEYRFYDEKVVILPGCYQANDNRGRLISAPPGRATAGLPEQRFVFCSFNSSYKLTPETFASWMRILKGVNKSVLWLLEGNEGFSKNILRHAEASGVAPERIIFAPEKPLDQHLARLCLADLFLDSLPYNAHTTASDALWGGVPVLTLRGTTFPGRVAASILYAAGLPELITERIEDFEALAVKLATTPGEIDHIKEKMSKECPLYDTELHCRKLENAFIQMWEVHLSGESK